jgi:predicted transposase YdaD
LPKIEEKIADFLCKIVDEDDKEAILHIEFQTSNHKFMHFRMLTYLTLLYKKYRLPVIQLVLYLGKGKMSMEDNISFDINTTKIDYRYKIVNISDLDCENFVNSDNSDLVVLGILCDFKNKDKKEVVKKIYHRLNELCKDDVNEMHNKILKLETFSKLRNLEDVVKKEEEMLEFKIKISDLPSYSIGHEQGANQREYEIAKNLLIANLDISFVSQTTGLKQQELLKLQKSIKS